MSTVTLKNAKGAGDFLRLRFWGTVLLMLGALLAFSAGSAFAAPAAGTSIGNQASASYKDNNNIDRVTVSNTVSTIVAQQAVANLVQTQSKTGAPGQTLSFPHTIYNNGNFADTFAVTVGTVVTAATFSPAPTSANALYADANCDGVADNSTIITSVGPVAAGGQGCFVAQVTLGTTGTGSFNVGYNSSVAGATLNANGVAGTTNTDTVTISSNAVINVTKSISTSTGPTGTVVTYQLTYRNTGTVSAGNVVVADTLPAGATYVAGSGRWSVASGTALTDADTNIDAGTAPYQIDYAFNAGTLSVVAILSQVDPGAQGIVEFQATLTGTAPTTVNNQAKWCYSDIGLVGTTLPAAVATQCNAIRATFGAGSLTGSDVTAVTGAANTNQTNIVPFFIPVVGVTGSVVINDNSTANTDGTNPVTVAAAQALADSSVDVAVATAGQGTLATWDAFVWNTGASTDTFNITLTGVSNYPVGTSFLLFRSDGFTPLTDSNGDGVLDTGPVNTAAFYRIRVVAVLPPSAAAGQYDAIVQAQSTSTSTAVNTVDVRAYVVSSRVDLTNANGAGVGQTAAGEGAAQTTVAVNPGSVATFGLRVQNTGGVSDSFDLSYNTGTGAYSNTAPFAFTTPAAGAYAVTFYRDNGSTCASLGAQLNNTGVIAPGVTVNVCALVTVPAGSAAATTSYFFRALSPTTFTGSSFTASSADVKHDALTVNTLRSVSITPNNSGQIFPGGSIQYCHTVKNSGNGNETLSLTQANQSLFGTTGWAQFATAYVDTNSNCVLDGTESAVPLTQTVLPAQVFTPGQTKNIIVVVQAPGAASAGQTNVNTFTLAPAAAFAATDVVNLTATDTTVIVVGQVQLVKDQALDNTCTAALSNATTFVQTQIPAAAPGVCIVYRVTATNIGTQSVNTVVINDTSPPNTTLHAAAVGTGCTAANGAISTNTTVSCTAAPGTVNAGSSIVLFFRVKINP